jgi:hypothetical protein
VKLKVVFDPPGIKGMLRRLIECEKAGYSKQGAWRKVPVEMCADSGHVAVRGHAIEYRERCRSYGT